MFIVVVWTYHNHHSEIHIFHMFNMLTSVVNEP